MHLTSIAQFIERAINIHQKKWREQSSESFYVSYSFSFTVKMFGIINKILTDAENHHFDRLTNFFQVTD